MNNKKLVRRKKNIGSMSRYSGVFRHRRYSHKSIMGSGNSFVFRHGNYIIYSMRIYSSRRRRYNRCGIQGKNVII